ncbi:MAG: beta-glucanase precursor [Planctomycetota bacterium]|jgi:hypothetical protein|nr:beta-glucanase precursor [Planctomycetota bacterium]
MHACFPKSSLRTLCLVAATASAAMATAGPPDFGDHTSATLTSKAWEALNAGDHDLVAAYTDKCEELYARDAAAQQASLEDFASGDDAHSHWAVNDVGTCLFIRGESLTQQGKTAEAIAAFKTLIDDYGYAQCWDTKGWFWKPAEAAAGKLKQLEFDAKLD